MEGFESFANTYCKYAIASYIVDEYRSYVVNQKMPIWHHQDASLLDCTQPICIGKENVCCRKRTIRLALIENMAAWLKNKDNLRYLHDGDACNCADKYSQQQMDYHDEFIDRLVHTGTIDIAHCHTKQNNSMGDPSLHGQSMKYKNVHEAISKTLSYI